MYKAIKYIMFSLATLLLCGVALPSCQSEEYDIEDEGNIVNVIVPNKVWDEMELCTRSSLAYWNASMKFSWAGQDEIGAFNVTEDADKVDNVGFVIKPGTEVITSSGSSAKFSSPDWSVDENTYWVAYSPYKCFASAKGRTKVMQYDEIKLSYEGQKQYDNAAIGGDYNGTGKHTEASEADACKFLGEYDYMISNPVKPTTEGYTTFKFNHVGATVRFFVQFPKGAFGGKTATITSMSVLNSESKLVKSVTLEINKNTDGTNAAYQVKKDENNQDKIERTNKFDLVFKDSNNAGLTVPDNGYVVAYMEFYPVHILENTSYLYFTAIIDGVEKYFRSKQTLPERNFEAGKLYQWKPTEWDTPIELTATLATWQEVLASPIDINLEN